MSHVHRDLVKVWHPDRFESDQRRRKKAEEQLKLIQEAYNGLREHVVTPVITDPVSRLAEPTTPERAAEFVGDYTDASPVYFSVGLVKLVVMSLCTFGLYQVYWFYRNWKRLREITSQPYLPFWRAVFPIFYCRSCFCIIRNTGVRLGIPKPPLAGMLGVLGVITELCWRLPTLIRCLFLHPWFTFCPFRRTPRASTRVKLHCTSATHASLRGTGLPWWSVASGFCW